MRVKVMVKNNQKAIKVPVGIRMLIRRCCQAVLVMEQFPHDAEVSVSFVSNAEIRNLNRIYRKKDSVTDVLSFPNETEGRRPHIGDMAVYMARAREQGERFGHGLTRETAYLCAHSALHLVGYDHEDESERAVMRQKEEAAMTAIGLPRKDD